ncbi:MAG: hypothetical protein RRY14_07730 [Hydrogenoanaerobacterium sp.]
MADFVSKREFWRYMKVQQSGRYNMLSPYAFNKTGLSLEKYEYILNNYKDLERQYGTTVPHNARRVTA